MGNDKRDKLTYTKDMLIKRISKECGYNTRMVKAFYNALEGDVVNLLSYANPDTDISIRLFEGITINSTFMPEKEKVNNLTGKPIITKSKVKAKANVTRSYCEKITDYNRVITHGE